MCRERDASNLKLNLTCAGAKSHDHVSVTDACARVHRSHGWARLLACLRTITIDLRLGSSYEAIHKQLGSYKTMSLQYQTASNEAT